jgi:hypothetical protein
LLKPNTVKVKRNTVVSLTSGAAWTLHLVAFANSVARVKVSDAEWQKYSMERNAMGMPPMRALQAT